MNSLASVAFMTIIPLFIVGWIVVCIAVGIAATARGRSLTAWALFAVFFSPVLGLLLLLALPNRRYKIMARRHALP
jgi:hypothetical protein